MSGLHDRRQNHQALHKLESLSQEQGAPLLCERAEKSVPGALTPRLSPSASLSVASS